LTAQSLINQAWIDLGVGAPGETIGAAEASNALNKMNEMLDSWSGAEDLIYEIALNSYALSNDQSFSIGPTAPAPFAVQRPVRIENADILITLNSGQVMRFPLRIIPQEEWESLPDRGAKGTVPDKLYYDPQVPNAVLNFHPIPLAADTTQVELGTWTPIGQFAALSTNANLPPTYARAIILGLQLELVPTYGNLTTPQIVQMRQSQFNEAICVVRAFNSKVRMKPLSPVNQPQQQQPQVNPQQLAALLGGRQQ
jgi:hypothetical protein